MKTAGREREDLAFGMVADLFGDEMLPTWLNPSQLVRGRRSKDFDANDSIETLLSVADQLDPPVNDAVQTTVEPPF